MPHGSRRMTFSVYLVFRNHAEVAMSFTSITLSCFYHEIVCPLGEGGYNYVMFVSKVVSDTLHSKALSFEAI